MINYLHCLVIRVLLHGYDSLQPKHEKVESSLQHFQARDIT
jgi:hypothetical protein